MNTFGRLFRITSWGESHGRGIGVVVDGCPPGIALDESVIQPFLDRRRPGQSDLTTPRSEADQCEILSGVFDGVTTGHPISVVVWNTNQRSKDYGDIKDVYRPSHSDYTYQQKYGVRDYRGGGRSSGRETVARVIGGAVAQQVWRRAGGGEVYGFTQAVAGVEYAGCEREFIEENPLRMGDRAGYDQALATVQALKAAGDSAGGVVEVRVEGVPVGLGSPAFGKLEGDLARACLSVGATKGFAMGEGFGLAGKPGSAANDPFVQTEMGIGTERNANGGVLGGISTGERVWFRVAVKPTSSISQRQTTVNAQGETVEIAVQGRHDPIIVPRVVPVLEAMTMLVLVDHLLLHQAQCGDWLGSVGGG